MPRSEPAAVTAAEFRAHFKGGNKYNARRTWSELSNRFFDSKAEANRGEELLLLQKAGEITGLEYQPTWVLSEHKGMKVKYKGDFGYFDCRLEKQVWEDVKGRDTQASRVKRAWLYDKLGVEVTVVWV